MTIIEFYDKNAIENFAGAMICRPDRVVVVGDDRDQIVCDCRIYSRILKENGIDTEVSYSVINKTNLDDIVSALDKIVSAVDDCIFDLTGGDELYLVAVGIMLERYGDRVRCQRFNFTWETVNDSDADGDTLPTGSFDISVEDNIAIYGGSIVTDPDERMYTYPWQFTDDFIRDIKSMWSICRDNPKKWNSQITLLGSICDACEFEDPLYVSFDPYVARMNLCTTTFKYGITETLLADLQSFGLIRSLCFSESEVSFFFKNEQVRRTLTVAGAILELYIASRMRALPDVHRKPLYNDVRVGAVISWDNDCCDDTPGIVNEIDVIAMKGVIPVFVSCKNGRLEVEELYKLNTVAEYFGGKYAKKVLVTTNLEDSGSNVDYLKARMEDFGIVHIDNVASMPATKLDEILRTLWSK